MIFGYLPKITFQETWYTKVMVWFYIRLFIAFKHRRFRFLKETFCFYTLNSLLYNDESLTNEYVAQEKVQRMMY